MITSIWSIGLNSSILIITIEPMDHCMPWLIVCFFLLQRFFPFRALQLTHKGRSLTIRLVYLTGLQRPHCLCHLEATSNALYSQTVKPDRSSLSLLYQHGYPDRRSRMPCGNPCLNSCLFAGCRFLHLGIFLRYVIFKNTKKLGCFKRVDLIKSSLLTSFGRTLLHRRW